MNASGKKITFAPLAGGFSDQANGFVDTRFRIERHRRGLDDGNVHSRFFSGRSHCAVPLPTASGIHVRR